MAYLSLKNKKIAINKSHVVIVIKNGPSETSIHLSNGRKIISPSPYEEILEHLFSDASWSIDGELQS